MDGLDHLRLVAAVAVLCFHYFFNGIVNGKLATLDLTPLAQVAKYGGTGVYLFFMISGFVIYASAAGRTPRAFAVGRCLRLYPAYWVAILLTAAVTVVWGAASGLSVSAGQVAVNLTMLQDAAGVAPVDGVYWTLFLELQFYVLVYLLLCFRLLPLATRLLPLWPALILVGQLSGLAGNTTPLVGGYFAFFAVGVSLCSLRRDGASVPRVTGLVLGLVAGSWAAAHHADNLTRWTETHVSSVVTVVIVIACAGLVALVTGPRARAVRLPGASAAGRLTYPLYLVHAHIGYILLTNLGGRTSPWLAYPVTVATVVLVAWLLHVLVEQKLAGSWRRIAASTVGPVADLLPRTVAAAMSRRSATG